MQLQLPTNATNGDIISRLQKARRDISASYKKAYDRPWVTRKSWERSPGSRVAFHKDKIPALKAAGLMKKPEDYNYGYLFPNEYLAKLSEDFRAIEKLLDEICEYLDDYTLRPKHRIYTEVELSRFEVIEGGGQLSAIGQFLLGGVSHV